MSVGEVVRLPRICGHRTRRRSAALSAWRDPLVEVASEKFRAVVAELQVVAVFGEPRWLAARDGDVGCAIALALEHVYRGRPSNPELARVLLTQLWVMACRGDEASRLTLEMLRPRIEEARST